MQVTVVRFSLSGPLSAETLGRPLGVRSGESRVGSNTTCQMALSKRMVESVSVVTIERFGFSGPLGPGESPDSLTDETVATVGVGGEGLSGLFSFFGGPLADALGRSLSVRETAAGMSSNTTTVGEAIVSEVRVSVVRFGFSGPFSTVSGCTPKGGRESGSTHSGPLESRRVVDSGVIPSGFGRSHSSQSGQPQYT